MIMIIRIWRGWTKPEDTESYERLLEEVIFPKIAKMEIKGYRKIQLFRQPLDHEIEFVTLMWFDSWDAVKKFAGKEYNQAYVPPEAQKLLSRYEKKSNHYEMRKNLTY